MTYHIVRQQRGKPGPLPQGSVSDDGSAQSRQQASKTFSRRALPLTMTVPRRQQASGACRWAGEHVDMKPQTCCSDSCILPQGCASDDDSATQAASLRGLQMGWCSCRATPALPPPRPPRQPRGLRTCQPGWGLTERHQAWPQISPWSHLASTLPPKRMAALTWTWCVLTRLFCVWCFCSLFFAHGAAQLCCMLSCGHARYLGALA